MTYKLHFLPEVEEDVLRVIYGMKPSHLGLARIF